jgi:hypothetical protein
VFVARLGSEHFIEELALCLCRPGLLERTHGISPPMGERREPGMKPAYSGLST